MHQISVRDIQHTKLINFFESPKEYGREMQTFFMVSVKVCYHGLIQGYKLLYKISQERQIAVRCNFFTFSLLRKPLSERRRLSFSALEMPSDQCLTSQPMVKHPR